MASPQCTITIDCQDDGTYQVTIQDKNPQAEQGEPAAEQAQEQQPQVVQSVDDVLQIVRQELSEGSNGSAQKMWDDEAAKRQGSDSGSGPSMSM